MADKKISALTAATTPLAGTEVLPIVQSGSTVKVSVDNLTAGKAVSATSIATGLGAVGTPAYTFTGDTNTGMWSPAADNVAVSTAGNERVRVTSTGLVGINTTNPSTLLQINSIGATSATNQGRIKLEDGIVDINTGSSGIEFTGSNFGLGYGWRMTAIDSSGVQFIFATRQNSASWTEAMRINAAGSVGINETAPDYRLDVNGTFGFAPGASVTPVDNGDVVFQLTNNTTLTVKAKGSDGVVRSGTIVLV